MRREYKDNLNNLDLKSILEEYTLNDLPALKNNYPENYFLLAEQIKLYPKAQEKLPAFAANYCFFTGKSYEQSSSESLALYKSGLFTGKTLLDLTGGLGVDDAAFASVFKKVVSVDVDKDLNNLVRINFQKLGIKNIERIDADAEEFIKNDIKAELIYIDADRRTNDKRMVTLENSKPDITKLLPRLYEISDSVLLKLSPLIDITYLAKSLQHISRISVVSLENEVKEILIQLKKNYIGKVILEAVDISKGKVKNYESEYPVNRISETINDGKYFYEPSNSIIKAGLVNNYANEKGLKLISKNGVFLSGSRLVHDFFGRKFIIIQQMPFSQKTINKYLREKQIVSANIKKRDFPLGSEQIRKMLQLKDGGLDYLFFTTSADKKKLLYHCRKA